MQPFPTFPIKLGHLFVRVIANRDHEVEILAQKLADVFRMVAGQLDSYLFHRLNRQPIHPRTRIRPCLELKVRIQRPKKPFRHLTSGRISGA